VAILHLTLSLKGAHGNDLSLKGSCRQYENRLCGSDFNTATEPVSLNSAQKAIENRHFLNKKLNAHPDTYCIRIGVFVSNNLKFMTHQKATITFSTQSRFMTLIFCSGVELLLLQ